ncbi:MAG: DNA alkylation repair protein [Anaerolineales bacterium]|nr:DNA alkylation repair protein [Anaerolineales bacterium]
MEDLITHKSWWDTVDLIAGDIVGAQFKRHPKSKARYLKRWRSLTISGFDGPPCCFNLAIKQKQTLNCYAGSSKKTSAQTSFSSTRQSAGRCGNTPGRSQKRFRRMSKPRVG